MIEIAEGARRRGDTILVAGLSLLVRVALFGFTLFMEALISDDFTDHLFGLSRDLLPQRFCRAHGTLQPTAHFFGTANRMTRLPRDRSWATALIGAVFFEPLVDADIFSEQSCNSPETQ
jgi:hypothetical protein